MKYLIQHKRLLAANEEKKTQQIMSTFSVDGEWGNEDMQSKKVKKKNAENELTVCYALLLMIIILVFCVAVFAFQVAAAATTI